jgi:hypothetical protein
VEPRGVKSNFFAEDLPKIIKLQSYFDLNVLNID